jgi:hypothetical protein
MNLRKFLSGEITVEEEDGKVLIISQPIEKIPRSAKNIWTDGEIHEERNGNLIWNYIFMYYDYIEIYVDHDRTTIERISHKKGAKKIVVDSRFKSAENIKIVNNIPVV